MDDTIARDAPEFLSKISELNKQVIELVAHLTELLRKVKSGDFPTDGGLGLLDAKLHLLLQYILNLAYVILLKLDGRSIDGAIAIERLVEIRTVMEKVRPIDKKLTYQIQKLIKLATSEVPDAERHPLSFRPNIDMLEGKESNQADASEADESEEEITGVYVPPKVSAVPYDEKSLDAMKARRSVKHQQKTLNSSLLKELRSELSEEPEEIRDDYRSEKLARLREKEVEREKFEEENLRRLQLSKRERQTNKMLNELDEIAHMGNFSAFKDDSDVDEDAHPKHKKQHIGFKRSGGKSLKKHKFKRRK